MILFLISLILSLIYFTIVIAFIVIIGILAYAYATVPTDESFTKYIKNNIRRDIWKFNKTSLVNHYVGKWASNSIMKMSDKEILNFLFFKIAFLNNPHIGQPKLFCGMFQVWYQVDTEVTVKKY